VTTIRTRVAIVGAGPAGLTASYLLTKQGRSVIVLEKDPVYVGGISRTVNYKGYLFDIGGHRFFSKSREVVDLWNEILPQDFIESPRLSRIYYGGKYYSYPLSAFEALRNLGLIASATCMLSYAYAKAFPIRAPRTFHDWVRNQFGERLFQIFFKTYSEKLWGISCTDMDSDFAAQRIKKLSLWEAIRNAFLAVMERRTRRWSINLPIPTVVPVNSTLAWPIMFGRMAAPLIASGRFDAC